MVREAGTRPACSQKYTTPHLQPDDGILLSRSRFEVILGELRRLMEKAAELEAVLPDWGQAWKQTATPAPETGQDEVRILTNICYIKIDHFPYLLSKFIYSQDDFLIFQ
jgi:hypothetical protein